MKARSSVTVSVRFVCRITAVHTTCADVLLLHTSSHAVMRWLLFEYCSVLYAVMYFSNTALCCVAALVVLDVALGVWVVVLFVPVVQPAIDNEAITTSTIRASNFFFIPR